MLTGEQLIDRAKRIRLLVLDVDGVLTDGAIIVDDRGIESKRFDVRDGFAVHSWLRVGHRAAILSGRRCLAVSWRARELGIDPVIQGRPDKAPAFAELMQTCGVTTDEICYIGDDLPDLPLILSCGIGATVADAAPEVRRQADWITQAPGGKGAVRELIQSLMDAQGLWTAVRDHYSQPALS